MLCRCQAHMQASSFPVGEALLEAFALAIIFHMLFGGLPLLSREALVGHLASVALLLCARLLARCTAATCALCGSLRLIFRACHGCFLSIATTHCDLEKWRVSVVSAT